ncbi:CoxG family protein [Natrarchaeobius sp. A-rgal3]|uniref:CoxG family protein n=1 Tax=Natrarchaeobius versutus TaxID=1679078 RepID=UPI00350E8F85
MEFSGTFELEETTVDEVWLALSDPALVEQSLPGCQFLVPVEESDVNFDELRDDASAWPDEPDADPAAIAERAFEEDQRYAALMQISVGPVNPTFETVVTVDDRDYPSMSAVGEGTSSNSSFEMASGMRLAETEDGVAVEWETEADVFGKIAQMGQRVVNPVANRVVKRFFSSVQDQLRERQLADLEERTDAGESNADETNADGTDSSDDDRGLVDRVLGRSDGDTTDTKR